ncbi:hypothetical protein KUTeg_003374 [Tegillarca granosa]|uniref:PDZ domain-containing protein n=1 Tax=Tegillarca granosa TaxID=220873 RepID=A0ABQ9FRH8_TEGGR|nr:hypothetical protein KUTeg_003374 [Tegillarca granosa]
MYNWHVCVINPNSKAYNEGIHVGDEVLTINGQKTAGLLHGDAQSLIKCSTKELLLDLKRPGQVMNGQMNGDIESHPVDLQMISGGGDSTISSISPTTDRNFLLDDDDDHVHDNVLSTEFSTSVWSPHGEQTTKQYKPVSFNKTVTTTATSSSAVTYTTTTTSSPTLNSSQTITVNSHKDSG